MRTGALKGSEVLKIEQAADERRQHRQKGFGLMKERDKNYAHLHTYFGTAREAEMSWGFDENTNFFELAITPYGTGGKPVRVVLDAEELRKALRWV